ncbi:lysophospholipid hydrolase [Nematocida minor]|uniref:lysophospholipid hydrolase n=1 Tax=Nematocida minor TaxID=1912983 RepID=UPI00221F94B2|nr:lysophospholipid hydrolase [Nematocida minor]KAI5189242.1 lysophospholipid hydrolase [Nematocida minor]
MATHSILFLIIAVIATLLAILAGRRVFKKHHEIEVERTETQPVPIKPSQGFLYSLLTDSELFSTPLKTTEDIEIVNGGVFYYLIEGEVEVLFDNAVVMVKQQDYFVYSIFWLYNVHHKTSVTYKIKKDSLLYKIDAENSTAKYLLLNRLFKGTVYTLVNYLEDELELDVRSIKTNKNHQELIENISKEVTLIKKVGKIEEITVETEEYTVPPNTLLYIIEGEGAVEYNRRSTLEVRENDLVGCLECVTALKMNRIVRKRSPKIVAVKIKLEPTVETDAQPLEAAGSEILERVKNKTQLEITDAMINWKMFQPGERLSADAPSKSIKIITNGYFLKEGDVKYFGISSKNTLFEKEVLLDLESPFQLVSTRLSEVIEIPKEYISIITAQFQSSSLELYKRILSRTGVEQELEQPSIITFIPNDPKETQLEIFTHFLRAEMIKSDSCFILSSAEIESKFKKNSQSKTVVLSLLNYISDLQKEYSYILIPIVGPVCIERPADNGDDSSTSASDDEKETGNKEESEICIIDKDKNETDSTNKESIRINDKNNSKVSKASEVNSGIKDESEKLNDMPNDSSSSTSSGANLSSSSNGKSKSNRKNKKKAGATGINGVLLSEIIFYVITNGDTRSINMGTDIFCKIDTLVLHRDNKMQVSRGKYYGQKHNLEFPVIDVPLSIIKTRESLNYTRKNHCTFTEHNNNIIPYFPLNDMHRFIRTLKGTNVGLVLGGGGARGIAHIGIIEALEEAGIPIDAIGGTSMGAFVGALYAEGTNNKQVFIRAKRLSHLIGSVWRIILDLTYPICSMFTGKGFNWGLRMIFKNKRIEDLWLPYYCITTDISLFEEKQHKQGILWRYVRASMSLSGYLPPLCDNGSFLLDGGYMNNVPADAMRSMGIRNIIAVDVGSEVETTFSEYGDSINGFYILFQKIFSTKKFLSLTEIQYRLAYLTSMHKERSLKSDVSIKYIRPDLAGYKTMNFRQFDEIVAHGYQYGKKIISEWKASGEYQELTTLTRATVKRHTT